MGKILDPNSGGPEPSAKPGTGGAPSPCRAVYMITPGIIHGRCAINEFRRQNPLSRANLFVGRGNSDTERYLNGPATDWVNVPFSGLFVTVKQTRRCLVCWLGEIRDALRISQNCCDRYAVPLSLPTTNLQSRVTTNLRSWPLKQPFPPLARFGVVYFDEISAYTTNGLIRRRFPLAGDGLGMVSGGVVFPGLSKLLHQEDALGVPCLDTVIVALRRRALAGRGNAADRPSSVTSMSPYGLLHRTSGWQALMLSRWWAADARVERMGARPNRVVVIKTALTCGSYSHSSTVLGGRREREKNSLVTMSARCSVLRGNWVCCRHSRPCTKGGPA
jgi:hypothetical protein